MTTGRDLAAVLESCLTTGSRAALALVVETDGSVYRRAGARSVVTENGAIHGIISGGCAEQDLMERAKSAWETGTVQRMTYDFRSPEDLLWGMGAGCNGSLNVCLLPMNPVTNEDSARRLVEDMRRRVQTKDAYVSITVLATSNPAKVELGVMPDAEASQLLASKVLEKTVRESGFAPTQGAEHASATGSTSPRLTTVQWNGVTLELFVEHVAPRPRLVIFGAGDDARPVARMAADVDWHTMVVDHRSLFNHTTRFPTADVLNVIRRDAYGTLDVDNDAFVVVMTHNYELDVLILKNLLPRPISYLGILGPRRRFDKLLADVLKAGIAISNEDLTKVHSPIGLDIGADTADDIAVSIVAELMACRRGRLGTSLLHRAGNITLPEASL